MWNHVLSVSSLATCLVFVSGCGSNIPGGRYAAKGVVYLDDELLSRGNITFFPDGRGNVASGGMIQDGGFKIPKHQGLSAGTYRVSVTAFAIEESESKDPDELMENPPEAISLIPKQYNIETTLTVEVEPSDKNLFTFHLQSK